jgi:ribosomal protein S18 acetylase RimI-like enzyme
MEIEDLLRSALDIYSSPLPGMEEMAVLADEGCLQCLADATGRLAGVLCIDINGELNTIRQLAVAPAFRNRGLADLMVKANIAKSQKSKIFDLWVKAENIPAIRLYEKNGYAFDGKRIEQIFMNITDENKELAWKN